ncbi:hypothetical protein JTE90_028758 [Oedothorax gibbosus]|uniref:Uncharacterized protein n=1 Tax=Oedothorax gibbosus TaxID=931172 RepID=A0AAV6VY27_9ARAC|nr:hypothetical protein JTE90_028758 [Oedothorax gibbosus]
MPPRKLTKRTESYKTQSVRDKHNHQQLQTAKTALQNINFSALFSPIFDKAPKKKGTKNSPAEKHPLLSIPDRD